MITITYANARTHLECLISLNHVYNYIKEYSVEVEIKF